MSDKLYFSALGSRFSSWTNTCVDGCKATSFAGLLCQGCHIDVVLDFGVTLHTWVVFVLSLLFCMAFVSLFPWDCNQCTCRFITWICLGNDHPVTVSSVSFDIMICSSLSMSLVITALCWQVEYDTEFDGHELRVAMPRKLPRNVLMCLKILSSSHTRILGRNIIYHLLFPNSHPRGRTAAGFRVQGCDNSRLHLTYAVSP